jgi:hypothetical protein
MLYCPNCGGEVYKDESFCPTCGEKLPDNIYDRIPEEKTNNKLWFIPIGFFIFILISIGSYYLYLEKQENEAKQLFNAGEKLALKGDFEAALHNFEEALHYKDNFPAAQTLQEFMQTAARINNDLSQANEYAKKDDFQAALQLINNSEDSLRNYNGDVVNILVNDISSTRKNALLLQLEAQLKSDPALNELKNLLWDAEAIQSEQAAKIAENIREQIVSYSFSEASEELKNNQFSNAREIIQEGLKYAPNSEKLLSLKTTVEKEKTAFETELEQRIEQAMVAAEEERNHNKNNAVEIKDVKVTLNEQNKLVVAGKIKSVATVPINSISVEYTLLDEENNQILANEVYAYPDTLYPEEEGKFEYTHFEMEDTLDVKVKIEKVKWFLD